jgi:hypothetical protein
MPTTLSDWIDQTREHLEGQVSELANQLDADYTPGDGVITLRHNPQGIGEGSLLSVGMNTMRVISVNQVAKQATVVAGYQSSTDVAAVAGDMVRVNPRFTDFRICRALNAHLNSLSSPRNGRHGEHRLRHHLRRVRAGR